MRNLLTISFLLFTQSIFSQCYEDRHNSSLDAAWISCESSDNPNSLRGKSHWILYDLKVPYYLNDIHLWNINHPDHLEDGISKATIDYSMDGVNWTEWGNIDLAMADGSAFYEGQEGPSLEDIEIRYLLITALENHGGSCYGLGEIKINNSGSPLATEESTLEKLEYDLFPNPANDITSITIESIESAKAILKISNIEGKILQQKEIHIHSGQNEITIPLQTYLSGTYFITIEQNDKVGTKKLIIENDRR